MHIEKESAPTVQSPRASVRKDGYMIPHGRRYDMARDDPEQWERGCRGLAWAFWAMAVLYAIWEVMA